jgi:hypothetical protein
MSRCEKQKSSLPISQWVPWFTVCNSNSSLFSLTSPFNSQNSQEIAYENRWKDCNCSNLGVTQIWIQDWNPSRNTRGCASGFTATEDAHRELNHQPRRSAKQGNLYWDLCIDRVRWTPRGSHQQVQLQGWI